MGRFMRIGAVAGSLIVAAGLGAMFIWPTYHWQPPQPYYSGILVLDLNGDGFQLHGLDVKGAFFGHQGDQFFQSTGWTSGAEDGILTFDRDHDDNIDGIRDLVA